MRDHGPACHHPVTIAEAVDRARQAGPRAVFLAGGTDIVLDLGTGRRDADELISLRRIPGLRGITVCDDGTLTIGAMTVLEDLARSMMLRVHAPVIAEAAGVMAGPQVRNVATVGGNLCGAVPCADIPPAAFVSGVRLSIAGPSGARQVPVEQFISGPRQTVLEPGELLTALHVDDQPAGSGANYQRFSRRRANSLAVASVAARVVLSDGHITSARVALGAVAATPLFVEGLDTLLEGAAAADSARIAAAASAAAEQSRPITDVRGTAAFRRELVAVLTTRALRASIEQASASVTTTARAGANGGTR